MPAASEKSPRQYGKAAYEADCLRRPVYHDGSPRKSWDNLPEIAKWSWERRR